MRLLEFVFALFVCVTCLGQAPFRISDHITDDSCRFTFDDDPIPNCVVPIGSRLTIARQYLARLDFSKDSLSPEAARYGLAVVIVGYSFDYVDRRGRILIQDVAEFDNGPSDFKYGVVRVVSGGKQNYATPSGKLLFRSGYDFAGLFWNGRAYGCIDCRMICDLPVTDWGNCEDINIRWVGGRWFRLTADGKATQIPPECWYASMRDPGIADRPTFRRREPPKPAQTLIN